MTKAIHMDVIKEIEDYLQKVNNKRNAKNKILISAANHMHLLNQIERNRVVKNLSYYIRFIAKCEPSESDKIIDYFKNKGYTINEFSKSNQHEIIVLY